MKIDDKRAVKAIGTLFGAELQPSVLHNSIDASLS